MPFRSISPGAFVAIIFGMFWKRTSAKAALWVALLCIPLSIGLFLMTDLPFFYRMTISFVVLSTLIVSLSYLDKPYSVDKKTDSKSALVILGTMLLTSIPFVLRIFTNDIILPSWFGALLLFMNVVCLYFVFSNKTNNRKAIVLDPQIFKTEKSFNMIAYIILIILSAIYGFLW
ncbi:hypothetical protein GCM10022396_19900 [Flavivirga amylovorans]